MKKFKLSFVLPVALIFQAHALSTASFSTAQDISANASSKLSLKNTGATTTLNGIYTYGIAWVATSEECTDLTITGANSNFGSYMGGGMATPMTMPASSSASIGKNYLYNMIMSNRYFWSFNGGGFSCTLPGCAWPGDTGPYKWCVKIDGIRPNIPAGTASTVPFGWPIVSLIDNYDYTAVPDVNNFVWLGPVTCNDQTLECAANTAQEQSF